MRTLSAVAVGLCSLSLACLACGGPAASGAGAGTPAAASSAATLEKSPDSGQVDRVGPNDGALKPDGVKDLAFVTRVEGPITALFLVSVDEQGKPTGAFHADTLVGQDEGPKLLGSKAGGTTSGIGVFEGDKVLNGPDGAIPPLDATGKRLTLYVAPTAAVQSGTRLRVYVLRPDRSVAAGASITN